ARVVRDVRGRAPCARCGGATDWKKARVLTTPPYDLDGAVAGVNLRWYLANSILRKSIQSGGSVDRTVFLSLHADSLHPAVRGALIYISREKFLSGPFRKQSALYAPRPQSPEEP